jgi:hypothetical protein
MKVSAPRKGQRPPRVHPALPITEVSPLLFVFVELCEELVCWAFSNSSKEIPDLKIMISSFKKRSYQEVSW